MTEMIILFTVTLVPIFAIMMMTPYLTRKTESFGVSIPASVYNDAPLKALRKAYVYRMGFVSLGILALFLTLALSTSLTEELIAFLFTGLIGVYLLISFFVYLTFHKQMKRLKDDAHWTAGKQAQTVIHTGFRQEKLVYSHYWFLIGLAVTIATAVVTIMFYDIIPDNIPTNYSLTGEVTGRAAKSYKTVFATPIIQVYLLLLFVFINTLIAKAKQGVSAVNPEDSLQRIIIFRRRWSAFTIITGTATVILLTLVQLSFIFPIDVTVLIISFSLFTIGVLIGAIGLSITTGQGGSRLNVEGEKDETVTDRDDDHLWKMGVFYFNKNDPSLFLEKRFGVGWTSNWAHPLSWIILIVILALSIGLPLFLLL